MVSDEVLSICLKEEAVVGPIAGLKILMNNLSAAQNPSVWVINQPLNRKCVYFEKCISFPLLLLPPSSLISVSK